MHNADFVSQVFQLLTDLKEQRKDSGKNKHSAGQQNLNTIMYEVGDYAVLFSSYCPLTDNLCFMPSPLTLSLRH